MVMDAERVSSALSALAEQLDYLSNDEIELVVCGGSALQALGLVHRTTRDVDVLALARSNIDGKIELFNSEPLPDIVAECARTVARDLRLPETWLNSGPADLLSQGLPDGLVSRLQSRRYGQKLVVHFISRCDQIFLKLFAVVNYGAASHHIADLITLGPTDEELFAAALWCLTQDASEAHPLLVRSCLEKLGYFNVVKMLESRT